jgi:hypothetical protein
MRELVIVKPTGKLGLLQMSGNMLIRHFLKASLQKVHFLLAVSLDYWKVHHQTYLILAPCASSSGRGLFSVLLNTIIVTIEYVHWCILRRCQVSVHLVHWRRHGDVLFVELSWDIRQVLSFQRQKPAADEINFAESYLKVSLGRVI